MSYKKRHKVKKFAHAIIGKDLSRKRVKPITKKADLSNKQCFSEIGIFCIKYWLAKKLFVTNKPPEMKFFAILPMRLVFNNKTFACLTTKPEWY